MSFFDDAISTIGKGLAQTAAQELSDATGYDIGGTLGFLFGGDQTTGGQNLQVLENVLANEFSGTKDQLDFLSNILTQQGQMLVDIGTELASIQESVNSIKIEIDKIEQLLDEIKSLQLYSNWQSVDIQIQVYVNAISSAYQTYSLYIKNFASTPTKEVELLIDNVLNANNGPRVGLNGISKFLLDEGMQKGALQLWSEMVCALVNSGKMDYRDAVEQYSNYYKKLVFAQLTATNLVMEAYNYSQDSINADDFYTQYKSILLSQESTFINWLIPIINSGISGGNISSNNFYYVYSSFDAANHLNPNFTTLENYTEYYSPSQILYNAEKMLSSLSNTDIDDRRIVVYMGYLGYPSMNNVMQTVNLSLTSCDKKLVVESDKVETYGPFMIYPTSSGFIPYPDPNFDSNTYGYYIKRFIFESNVENVNLHDTSYNLTNQNGKGNLLPMGTYASQYKNHGSPYGINASFMTDSVLNYVLTVDETTNFDFMNFLAYNYPSPQTYPIDL